MVPTDVTNAYVKLNSAIRMQKTSNLRRRAKKRKQNYMVKDIQSLEKLDNHTKFKSPQDYIAFNRKFNPTNTSHCNSGGL